jgi:hypothetical protein
LLDPHACYRQAGQDDDALVDHVSCRLNSPPSPFYIVRLEEEGPLAWY